MKEGKKNGSMYLVEVIPLSKSPLASSLSYFSGEKLTPGTIVGVPVRYKLTPAIVISSKDVRSAKSDIRRAGFLLKKIRKADIMAAILDPYILEAAQGLARFYAAPIGTILTTLLPKVALDKPEIFFPLGNTRKKPNAPAPRETFLLQMESEERFGQYRALVRQAFARETSVMLIVPTHLDAERAAVLLSKGISEFVHVFTLEGRNAARQAWTTALTEKHPILFITTPAGILFSRPDLDTIIVERLNSRAFRTLARPFLDMRAVAERLAKASGRQLVIGDSVLPVETLWREKRGDFGETSLIRWRLPAATARVVDARTKQDSHGGFEIFTPELKELLARAVSENRRIFLFGARKGLAPTTVCGDCGTVLPCENCGAPVVLHRRGEMTLYVCHACSATREPSTLCGTCRSWRLVPLGVGTEEIARQASLLFPDTPVTILDKDHAPTDAKAAAVAEEFRHGGGILVGTEYAFYYLDPVPYSAVVSVDALFSIPDFYINERVFYLVSRLRETTQTETLIQTRNIGRQTLAWAAQGNISDFYQTEIDEREALLYPPFSIFVKITVPKERRETLQSLRETFRQWEPDIFRDSLVMRVPRTAWPDEELTTKLSLLGPEFSIKVDPESLMG